MNPNGPQPGSPDGPTPWGGGGAWPTIINAGAGIYDTYQRHRDVKSEQKARKAEAELAYQRSVEMWHMQNQYNSPEQQMSRFGAAGLNPHLVYSQGNPGNAGAPPDYHPPDIQMAGMHPPYGGAVQTMLPMLMQVGSWMQNMRLTETEIDAKQTGMSRTQQLIDFLNQRNPKDLERLDNQLSIFPYQKSAARNIAEKSNLQLTDMLEMLRYNWGQEYQGLEFGDFAYKQGGRGAKAVALERLKAETRLKSAQADWFEPATIMRMVLSAVGGLTGIGRLVGGRTIPRAAGKAVIGKGQKGRWSMPAKRWVPTKTRSGQWKSETP